MARGERHGTPIPHRDRELAATKPSPVVTYFLTPEELEQYRQQTAKPSGKAPIPTYGEMKDPVGLPSTNMLSSEKQSERAKKRYEGAIEMVELTKEKYFEERIAGKARTAIMKEHFGKNQKKFYKLLKEWGIKDPVREELEIDAYAKSKNAELQSADSAGGQAEAGTGVQSGAVPAVEAVVSAVPGSDRADRGDEVVVLHEQVEWPKADGTHPDHYKVGGIEPIDVMRAKLSREELMGFFKGNVIKYILRASHKGGKDDLKKAAVYLNWAIEAWDGNNS